MTVDRRNLILLQSSVDITLTLIGVHSLMDLDSGGRLGRPNAAILAESQPIDNLQASPACILGQPILDGAARE